MQSLYTVLEYASYFVRAVDIYNRAIEVKQEIQGYNSDTWTGENYLHVTAKVVGIAADANTLRGDVNEKVENGKKCIAECKKREIQDRLNKEKGCGKVDEEKVKGIKAERKIIKQDIQKIDKNISSAIENQLIGHSTGLGSFLLCDYIEGKPIIDIAANNLGRVGQVLSVAGKNMEIEKPNGTENSISHDLNKQETSTDLAKKNLKREEARTDRLRTAKYLKQAGKNTQRLSLVINAYRSDEINKFINNCLDKIKQFNQSPNFGLGNLGNNQLVPPPMSLKYKLIDSTQYDNEVFKQYECCIGYNPCRYPIKFGNDYFELSTLATCLETNPSHPLTRQPLTLKDLLIDPIALLAIQNEMIRLGIPLQ